MVDVNFYMYMSVFNSDMTDTRYITDNKRYVLNFIHIFQSIDSAVMSQ